MNKVIFIVDDNTADISRAEKILESKYRVIAFSCPENMFKALEESRPNLILLNIESSEAGGIRTINKLKANLFSFEIPVILLTEQLDAENEAHGIELGAVDFILKPYSEIVMLSKIKKHLHIDDLIREKTAGIFERAEQLKLLKNGIVYTMADLVENRDGNTGGHIDRTSVYMEVLINAMLEQDIYADEIREWDLELVISSARLHDVGKIEIPDCILNKPDSLSVNEFDIMKTHSAAGEQIIDRAIARTGDEEFLYNAKIIATYHHERWNGTGYPYAMKETEIPLQARIMAIIDVYDALVSERPYKEAFPHEKAMDIIMDESGKHFDPYIAEVFNSIQEQIRDVKNKI